MYSVRVDVVKTDLRRLGTVLAEVVKEQVFGLICEPSNSFEDHF